MAHKILTGDALTHLRTLRDQTIHTCITSPPYFGLRDYGTASWSGGDPDCDHRKNGERRQIPHGDGRVNDSYKDERHLIAGAGALFGGECGKCGALRVDTQIGLESSPAEYVEKLVEVFREVRRVLRDDGTLWLNLGDSYASAWACNRRNVVGNGSMENGKRADRPNRLVGGLKEKDLMGIPWRVAFALQADGWYLRQDIIWHKPNPMPESVRDRCTKAHEYLFMLSKSPTYYFDSDAIREPNETAARKGDRRSYKGTASSHSIEVGHVEMTGSFAGLPLNPKGRNKRSVWTVSPKPFREAHFATFPPDLIRPCVLAGSTIGGVVLDPFSGAATTGVVATEHGRHFIGIELNPEYVEMSEARLARHSAGEGTKPLPPALPIVATSA